MKSGRGDAETRGFDNDRYISIPRGLVSSANHPRVPASPCRRVRSSSFILSESAA